MTARRIVTTGQAATVPCAPAPAGDGRSSGGSAVVRMGQLIVKNPVNQLLVGSGYVSPAVFVAAYRHVITQHSDRNNITRIKKSMLNQIQQIQSLGVS
jgi:hypothetical protein